MSTSFHPQTDGVTERMNRSVGEIFRAELSPNQKDWIYKVDLTEFAINSSIRVSARYSPFELNGGYMPSMIRQFGGGRPAPRGIKVFARTALENMADAHDAIIASRIFQTHYSNRKRSPEPDIDEGSLVYLSTVNLNMPKGRARKLCPKFVGPYRVLEAKRETSTYLLELPPALASRNLHPRFHVSLLRRHIPSDDLLFPARFQPGPYDFGAQDDDETFVDEILGHRWCAGKSLEFQIRWSDGDTTWEPLATVRPLEVLRSYLAVQGVKTTRMLSKRVTGGD